MENDYKLIISPAALSHIREVGLKQFDDAYVLVLADTHAIGGIVVPEIHPIEMLYDNYHFRELFPRDYQNYGFPIYVDRTMEREGYLPQHMLIDFLPTYEGMNLVFKNPDFES
ncbi:MAG: iron-sulfur cluster biosynthesis family protein [Candidatus Lokiarchaeota archaeon]|nr:iron-sulfur cluster biosynthesis family protein [Candidatus Harpocratesius repetitus]